MRRKKYSPPRAHTIDAPTHLVERLACRGVLPIHKLARKVAEAVRAEKADEQADTDALIAELRSQQARIEEKRQPKEQEKAKAERKETLEGTIKEAGSSLTGLTMLMQGLVEAEQAQIREQAEKNPLKKPEYPDAGHDLFHPKRSLSRPVEQQERGD